MEAAPTQPDKGLYFIEDKPHLEFIHSGCTLLDCVLGGGWAEGRVANVLGDPSTGKTLVSIEGMVNFIFKYAKGQPYYAEAEGAFDKLYAAALGAPIEKIRFPFDDLDSERPTVEHVETLLNTVIDECFDRTNKNAWDTAECKHTKITAHVCVRCKKKEPQPHPGILIIDSLDGLTCKAELDRKFGEGTYGTEKARLLSELFRRNALAMSNAKVTLFVISQTRDNIGSMFGGSTTSGGRAIGFYSSQTLQLRQTKQIKRTVRGVERAVGIEIMARMKKSKVGIPLRECSFPILFGYGIDDLTANIKFLETVGKEERFLEGKALSTFVKKTHEMDREKYNGLKAAVAEVVRAEWKILEKDFLPKRAKY